MSKNHEGHIKEYRHMGASLYSSQLADEDYVDEVMFGFYAPEGGTSGEMGMRWYKLDEQPCPRLEVFTGSWHALWQFKDLLMALAHFDDQDITPQEFCQILDHCGFTDRTHR